MFAVSELVKPEKYNGRDESKINIIIETDSDEIDQINIHCVFMRQTIVLPLDDITLKTDTAQ
jgi:hypothetical protein